MEALTLGGAYLWTEICGSKSIRLAYSWKEFYRFFFVLLCIWIHCFQVQVPGALYSEGSFNETFFALRFWGAYIWRGLYMEGLIFQEFDRSNRVLSGCVGQRDSNINLAWKTYLIVFDALFLIQSVVMVFCYGSLIRGLYFTNTVCPETETTDGERSSEKKKLVITFLLATLGFLIGYVPSMTFYTVVAFQTNANIGRSLFSDLENAFQFLFGCSLCLNPLVYAFRSAHFREGFRRVLTTCWKPTPQDDDIQWFRYFFLFKSQHEVEESWGPRTLQ